MIPRAKSSADGDLTLSHLDLHEIVTRLDYTSQVEVVVIDYMRRHPGKPLPAVPLVRGLLATAGLRTREGGAISKSTIRRALAILEVQRPWERSA